ncbi:Ankyrin repeat and KH domain-containing protein mask [Diplonema papillatum]|nr:Ankyrin repeat and KH domain-containing protein mask [Diplonema papillatum]
MGRDSSQMLVKVQYPLRLLGCVRVARTDKVRKVIAQIVQRYPGSFSRKDDLRLAIMGRLVGADEKISNVMSNGDVAMVAKVRDQMPKCPRHELEMLIFSKRFNHLLCHLCWTGMDHAGNVIDESDAMNVAFGDLPLPEQEKVLKGAAAYVEECAKIAKKESASMILDNGLVVRGSRTRSADNFETPDGASLRVSALMLAVMNNQVPTVEVLLEKTDQVDYLAPNGMTALMVSCWKNHSECTKLILERNASVQIWRQDGCLASHIAAFENSKEALEVLLDSAPEVLDAPRKVDGATPLTVGAFEGHERIVELLLERGADVNYRDSTLSTPLVHAVCRGHGEVARLLLDSKAVNARMCNRHGCVPLALAAGAGLELGVVERIKAAADANGAFPYEDDVCDPITHAVVGASRSVIEQFFAWHPRRPGSNYLAACAAHRDPARAKRETLMYLLDKIDVAAGSDDPEEAAFNRGMLLGADGPTVVATLVRVGDAAVFEKYLDVLVKWVPAVDIERRLAETAWFFNEEPQGRRGRSCGAGQLQTAEVTGTRGSDAELWTERTAPRADEQAIHDAVNAARPRAPAASAAPQALPPLRRPSKLWAHPLLACVASPHADAAAIVKALLSRCPGAAAPLAADALEVFLAAENPGPLRAVLEHWELGGPARRWPDRLFTPVSSHGARKAAALAHACVVLQDDSIAAELIQAGARPTDSHTRGSTPLSVVAAEGTLRMWRALLAAEADTAEADAAEADAAEADVAEADATYNLSSRQGAVLHAMATIARGVRRGGTAEGGQAVDDFARAFVELLAPGKSMLVACCRAFSGCGIPESITAAARIQGATFLDSTNVNDEAFSATLLDTLATWDDVTTAADACFTAHASNSLRVLLRRLEDPQAPAITGDAPAPPVIEDLAASVDPAELFAPNNARTGKTKPRKKPADGAAAAPVPNGAAVFGAGAGSARAAGGSGDSLVVRVLCAERRAGTPLFHYAVEVGALSCLQLVEQAQSLLFLRDAQRRLPLHIACVHGHANVCQWLTSFGGFPSFVAQMKAEDADGYTPGMRGVENRRLAALHFLCGKLNDPNLVEGHDPKMHVITQKLIEFAFEQNPIDEEVIQNLAHHPLEL